MDWRFALAALLLLSACAAEQPAPVCNAPYLLVGTDCCLDQNNNTICDRDEPAPKADNASAPVPAESVQAIPSTKAVQDAVVAAFGKSTFFSEKSIITWRSIVDDINNSRYRLYFSVPATIIELREPGNIGNTSVFGDFMEGYARARYDRFLQSLAEAIGTTTYQEHLVKTDWYQLIPTLQTENKGDIFIYSDWAKAYYILYNTQGSSFLEIDVPVANVAIYVYCTPRHVVAVYYTGSSATGAEWSNFKEAEYEQLIKDHVRSEIALVLPKADSVLAECKKLMVP